MTKVRAETGEKSGAHIPKTQTTLNHEIDGKKSVSTWLTLKIEGGPQAATPAATTPDTAPAPAPPAAVDPEDDDVLNGLTIVMIIIFAALVVVASTVSWFVARRTTNA